MKILLHDGYNRGGLSEPISLTIAGLIAASKAADKYVKENYGSWAGLNGKLLSLIGRHPSTDPKAIEALRKAFFTPGDTHYNTNLGAYMRAINNGSISNADLMRVAANLQGGMSDAKKGADKGDWAAARYLVVYSEFLKTVQAEMEKRAANYNQQAQTNAGIKLPNSGAPSPFSLVKPPPTDAPSQLKSLALPVAAILAFKLLF
jgi:hypothetical protein